MQFYLYAFEDLLYTSYCMHFNPGKANAEASQHVRNVLMALYRRRLFWRLRRRPPRPVVGEAGMTCPCRMASISLEESPTEFLLPRRWLRHTRR
jgi:hypothetical protein